MGPRGRNWGDGNELVVGYVGGVQCGGWGRREHGGADERWKCCGVIDKWSNIRYSQSFQWTVYKYGGDDWVVAGERARGQAGGDGLERGGSGWGVGL